MGMTMTQKILAAHAGLDHVEAGQLIEVNLDMVLGNDITSPVAIKEFEKYGFTQVFDPGKISMVMDHFAPNKDIKAAQQCKACRTFAYAKNIEHLSLIHISRALDCTVSANRSKRCRTCI